MEEKIMTAKQNNGVISNHTNEELNDLFKNMHLKRWKEIYYECCGDMEFAQLSFADQMHRMLKLYKSKSDISLLNKLNKRSGLAEQELNKIQNADSPICIKELEVIINSIVNRECRAITITGFTGTGKTTLAKYILNLVIKKNLSAYYEFYDNVISKLGFINNNYDNYQEYLKDLAKHRLLILDDALIAINANTNEAKYLKDLLEALMKTQCSLLLVSQRSIENWYTYFGNNYLTDAIIDRLNDGAIRVKLDGKSLRNREKIEIKSDTKNEEQ